MKKFSESLKGTGQVYSFTVKQYVKNKSNIAAFIILLVAAVASTPLMSYFSGNFSRTEIQIPERVYINNETSYKIEFNTDETEYVEYNDVSFENTELSEDSINLTANEAYVHLYYDETLKSYVVNSFVADESNLMNFDVSSLTSFVKYKFENARSETLSENKVFSEKMESLFNYSISTGTLADYTEGYEENFSAVLAVQYGYSIIVLILCVMSSTYIIRAVLEEKASKLIDLLTVSVKPLALISGKILGVMTCIFGQLLIVAGGFALSSFVTGRITKSSPLTDLLDNTDAGSILSGIGAGTIIAALVSLILGYLTFSIISGISGASASSMNEMEFANLAVMLLILAGYMTACITCAIDSSVVAYITSLLPIISVFCAPVRFVLGDIGIIVLVLSWIIQLVGIIALAIFSSRIYSSLILHKGSRLKLKEIFILSKGKSSFPD